jgi:uncharacterized protein (TIRG00374 family)
MKKLLLALLQLALTAGLLWLVFRGPAKQTVLKNAVQQTKGVWLLAGIGAYGTFELLAGIRWQILLRVQGIYISWLRLYGLLMVGLFFSLFIPGGTGGDLVKAYYLLKEAPADKKTAGILSIVMDRLVGLLAVALLTLVISVKRWDWLTAEPTPHAIVLTGMLVLVVSMVGILAGGIVASLHLAHKLPHRFPFRETLVRLSTAINLYRRAWLATGAALAISVVAHLAHYTTFWATSRGIAHWEVRTPTALELYSTLPVIETVAALPVTPGGLGTREKLFDEMLTTLADLESGVAASISMLGYACIATWGVVGGILYLFYRPTPGERKVMVEETRAKIQHVEEEAEEILN